MKMATRSSIILMACATTLAVGASLRLGREPSVDEARRQREERIASQGRPWNGGKPSAPVALESSVEGEIPAEDWVEIELRVIPQAECRSLESRARGLDGLEVSDDSVWNHPDCRLGEPSLRQLRVRVPRDTSGLLAVDIRLELENGSVYQVTRSVGLRAEGAPVLPSSEQTGE